MLSSIADSPRVAVLTTSGCAFCRRAKTALTDAGIDFQEIDLSSRLDALDTVKQITGQTTVPQVFVGGKLIGGASELLSALQDGSFADGLLRAKNSAVDALPADIAEALNNASSTTRKNKPTTPTFGTSPEYLQLEKLAQDMQSNNIGPSTPTATAAGVFSAKQAADWLVAKHGMDYEEATKTLSDMQKAQILTIHASTINPQTPLPNLLSPPSPSTSPSSTSSQQQQQSINYNNNLVQLQWVSLCPPPRHLTQPLNGSFRWFGTARTAVAVSADLRTAILKLYDIHMTQDGRKVNYKAMAKDPLFTKFTTSAAELQAVDVTTLTRAEALSFYINIYNALIVHATAVFGPAKSTLARLRWFDDVSYEIGGQRFSANDIEHGILRGNAPSPASPLSLVGLSQWAPKTFSSPNDPRLKLSFDTIDPRIHFALNCGATSCPPIRVYTPERVEAGLEAAAAGFCTEEVKILSSPSASSSSNSASDDALKLELSMIFKWYGKDFGSKEELLKFIAQHTASTEVKSQIEAALRKHGGADGVKMMYKPYDWTVNAVE